MAKRKLDFLLGTLDLIVLRLLQGGPANGLELTRRIEVVSKSTFAVNYGSLYPALHRLEAKGWIEAEWRASESNRRARYYRLTNAGRRQLGQEQESWERFAKAMHLILRTD